MQRRWITDLGKVEPRLLIKDNENIEIRAEIRVQFGSIIKVVEVSTNSKEISLSYDFSK